jgi:hypothetical protein
VERAVTGPDIDRAVILGTLAAMLVEALRCAL